jgi:hypothetical protein
MAPRGRPAIPKAPTKFMNKKHRVIMMTADGKYVVKTDKGTAYNPKAAYVKSPGGTVRTLTNSGARVPTAIRPKATRKVRKNRGKARSTYRGAAVLRLAPRHGPVRRVGRPRKHMVSPGPLVGLAGLRIVPRRGRPAKMPAGYGARVNAMLRSMTPR